MCAGVSVVGAKAQEISEQLAAQILELRRREEGLVILPDEAAEPHAYFDTIQCIFGFLTALVAGEFGPDHAILVDDRKVWHPVDLERLAWRAERREVGQEPREQRRKRLFDTAYDEQMIQLVGSERCQRFAKKSYIRLFLPPSPDHP